MDNTILSIARISPFFIEKMGKKIFLQKTLVTFDLGQKHTYEAPSTYFGTMVV